MYSILNSMTIGSRLEMKVNKDVSITFILNELTNRTNIFIRNELYFSGELSYCFGMEL